MFCDPVSLLWYNRAYPVKQRAKQNLPEKMTYLVLVKAKILWVSCLTTEELFVLSYLAWAYGDNRKEYVKLSLAHYIDIFLDATLIAMWKEGICGNSSNPLQAAVHEHTRVLYFYFTNSVLKLWICSLALSLGFSIKAFKKNPQLSVTYLPTPAFSPQRNDVVITSAFALIHAVVIYGLPR